MRGKVVSYDHLGRGIIKEQEKVIFIPYTKKGEVVEFDIVEEKKKFMIATRKDKVLQEPIFCPYYFQCGGCQLQHLTLEEQLAYKQQMVQDIFQKYANIAATFPIISTPSKYYRNKVTFHIKGNQLGFYQEKTHTLLTVDTCPLLQPKINAMIPKIKLFIQDHLHLEEVMIRLFDDKIMLCFQGNCDVSCLVSFFAEDAISIYYQNQLVYGQNCLETTVLGKHFFVSAEAFFQVNSIGMKKIYSLVIDAVKRVKSQIVLDLYCGTGTISLLVADDVKKVVGVELNQQAVADAKRNASYQGCQNAIFYAMDAAKIAIQVALDFDTVIVDPPRAGLSKKTKELLAKINPKTIIYVSCNPLTLARDIKDLDGYILQYGNLVDEFPETYHVECVVVLHRRKHED